MDAVTLALAKNYSFKGENVVTVASKNGQYSKLSDALTAITDAAIDKQYRIIVVGDIFETVGITAKSYINVEGIAGASLTITRTDNTAGVTFDSLTATTWKNLKIFRVGAVTQSFVYAVNIKGTCDDTVMLQDCYIRNSTTQGGSADHRIGLHVMETANPTVTNCEIWGAAGANYGIGLFVTNRASGIYSNCLVYGGGGSANCWAVYSKEDSSPLFFNTYGKGGDGGTTCHGFYVREGGKPTATNCLFVGGNGGTFCRGMYLLEGGSPILSNVTLIGGSGGAGCEGMRATGNSAPVMNGVTIEPPSDIVFEDLSATGTMVLSATQPHQIFSMSVQVITAAPGETLSIGTTLGGAEIVDGLDISTTGTKTVTLEAGALGVLAENTTLHVTFSGGGRAIIRTTFYYCNTTCYGVHVDTIGRLRMNNCTIVSNAASWSCYVSASAVNANKIQISNCHIEQMIGGTTISVYCVSAYANAPFYQSVLVGSTVNLTAKSAVATNGTNVRMV